MGADRAVLGSDDAGAAATAWNSPTADAVIDQAYYKSLEQQQLTVRQLRHDLAESPSNTGLFTGYRAGRLSAGADWKSCHPNAYAPV